MRLFRCRRIFIPVLFICFISLIIIFLTWTTENIDKEIIKNILSTKATYIPKINKLQIEPPNENPIINERQMDNANRSIKNSSDNFISAFRFGTPITKEEIRGGESKNATVNNLRNRVRKMMQHAWKGYATYAWGSNELKPLSKTGHLPFIFGKYPLGTTIVDGLDTLYIMGLDDEFQASIHWISNVLKFENSSMVSVFEFNIRYLGSLLSTYTFTRNPVKVIRTILQELIRSNGLFTNYLNPITKQWCGTEAGLSAMGDSFYEYLLKEWIRTNYTDTMARQLYDSGMDAFDKVGLFKRSEKNNLYVGNYKNLHVSNTMDHLACFAGGMLALSTNNKSSPWFKRAIELTETCRKSYASTSVGLGPETFVFDTNVEAIGIKSSHKHYILRPETVESYFYLWRYTKDQKYRDWSKDVIDALETYARTPDGYSGLVDVYSTDPNLDDVQQSYFLAETLKYLYLIFSEDSLLPLNRWVFNTEAHPLPIQTRITLPVL